MNDDFSWIPGTIALAVGLAAGLFIALRLRRPASTRKSDPLERELKLEIADLEARRDEIYQRLRGEHDEELDEGETRTLELAAARTLMQLDRARKAFGKIRSEPAGDGPEEAPVVQAAPQPAAAMHHPFLWFLAGAGLMALVGVLIFWALQDARPDPMAAQNSMAPAAGAPAVAPAAGNAPEGHPEGLKNLSPEVRAQAESLQAELASNPGNLGARKQLAVLLASNQLFFQAFQHSEQILQAEPDDPDALYISGLVRLTMGQPDVALAQIDRVLAQFPQHVLAHVVRGMALVRLDRPDEGLGALRDGLRASGGNNRDIERLIVQEFGQAALAGDPASPPSGAPAAGAPASGAPAAPSPPVASAAPQASGPREYRVYVELASDAEVPAGSSLFISVHDLQGGGPPAAVRRVADPEFPVEVTLSARDSMTGIALPATGMILVRLDSDGNPGTESPDDLWARGEGSSGEVTKFVLW